MLLFGQVVEEIQKVNFLLRAGDQGMVAGSPVTVDEQFV
jgi:hypothetical protein